MAIFLFCGALGALCSLSFGPLSGVQVAGMTLFDLFDWLCSNVLLLVMALLAVIFTGFFLSRREVHDEFTSRGRYTFNDRVFPLVWFLIKWVAPVAVVIIFFTNFIL